MLFRSETGAGTETETGTGTGTGTEKRQGIGKRLPRTPKPERRKTSGKQTGNSRNRNPAHRRAQWISGKKFAGTKKSGYLCNPESGRFPRPEMPGIDTRQPCGVAQGQSRGQGRERRGVAQSGSARALGAWGRGFKSLHPDSYYSPSDGKYGPVVSGLRHRPFTAATRVRIPTGSSFFFSLPYGPLAQLVRATGLYPVGPGFESLKAYFLRWPGSSVG